MGTCALSIESETTHIGTNNVAATSQSQPFTQVCLSIVEDHPECPQPFQMVNLFRPRRVWVVTVAHKRGFCSLKTRSAFPPQKFSVSWCFSLNR